jgi:hypothetical protein
MNTGHLGHVELGDGVEGPGPAQLWAASPSASPRLAIITTKTGYDDWLLMRVWPSASDSSTVTTSLRASCGPGGRISASGAVTGSSCGDDRPACRCGSTLGPGRRRPATALNRGRHEQHGGLLFPASDTLVIKNLNERTAPGSASASGSRRSFLRASDSDRKTTPPTSAITAPWGRCKAGPSSLVAGPLPRRVYGGGDGCVDASAGGSSVRRGRQAWPTAHTAPRRSSTRHLHDLLRLAEQPVPLRMPSAISGVRKSMWGSRRPLAPKVAR